MRYCNSVWQKYISVVDSLSCARVVFHFVLDLSPLNQGGLRTLNSFHFLLDILIIFGRVIYQVKTVCHIQK